MIETLCVGQPVLGAFAWRLEHHDPQRNMDLWRGKPRPARIDHGLQHVGDQAVNLRRGGIGNWSGTARQHRMSHSGDFEDRHGPTIDSPGGNGQRSQSSCGATSAIRAWVRRAAHRMMGRSKKRQDSVASAMARAKASNETGMRSSPGVWIDLPKSTR